MEVREVPTAHLALFSRKRFNKMLISKLGTLVFSIQSKTISYCAEYDKD